MSLRKEEKKEKTVEEEEKSGKCDDALNPCWQLYKNMF
jgi:hypothetical protein